MLAEIFIIRNVIFAHLRLFLEHYIGKSSGKHDHYDLNG